jgi:GNAT superfamily N-acetyltransferase
VQTITTMLDGEHRVDRFSCGLRELDRYLKRFALANQIGHMGVTYVAARPIENRQVVAGYYTLAMSHVDFADLPEDQRGPRDPRYSRPTVLLAKLAVDRSEQGKGLGEKLLIDAMRRASAASAQVAAVALEVDAITDAARAFYKKYGFIEYLDHPKHLFLPMRTIDQLFGPGG